MNIQAHKVLLSNTCDFSSSLPTKLQAKLMWLLVTMREKLMKPEITGDNSEVPFCNLVNLGVSHELHCTMAQGKPRVTSKASQPQGKKVTRTAASSGLGPAERHCGV